MLFLRKSHQPSGFTHPQFPAKVGKGILQGLEPAGLNVSKPSLNTFDGIFAFPLKRADAFHKQSAR